MWRNDRIYDYEADYATAYKKLEEAKDTLSQMADQLKNKLEQQITQAMTNLDGPISISLR